MTMRKLEELKKESAKKAAKSFQDMKDRIEEERQEEIRKVK